MSSREYQIKKYRKLHRELNTIISYENEIWKPIEEFSCYCEISNFGRVRSIDREFNGKLFLGKLKKLTETSKRNGKQGYLCTRIKDENGKSHCVYVHILVAKAFVSNPKNKQIVNHKDGNKHNNYYTNLEWSTYSENNKHAVDNNLRPKYCGFLRDYNKKQNNK